MQTSHVEAPGWLDQQVNLQYPTAAYQYCMVGEMYEMLGYFKLNTLKWINIGSN